MSHDITEAQALTEFAVDQEARTIRGAVLLGQVSKNGHSYSRDALEAAVPLYSGVTVHVPADGGHSPAMAAAVVRNPRRETSETVGGDRIRGDLVTLDTEAGRTLLALATLEASGLGLSHVARVTRSGNVITKIDQVRRLDLVHDPATTTSLAEQAKPLMETLTTEQIREQALAEARRELAEASTRYAQLYGPVDGPAWLAEGLTTEQCWQRRAESLTQQLAEQTRTHAQQLAALTTERDDLKQRLESLALGEQTGVENTQTESAQPQGIPIRIAG
jgi:hypothetical protein